MVRQPVAAAANNTVWELCKALQAAKRLEDVKMLLNIAATLYKPPHAVLHPADLPDKSFGDLLQQLAALKLHLCSTADNAEIMLELQEALDLQYSTLAQSLLTDVAPKWLRHLSPAERSQTFDHFFLQAPATAALSALVRHLSLVLPHKASAAAGGRAFVTAVASDTASQLLCQRFARPGSTGVRDLLLALCGSTAGSTTDMAGQQRAAGLLPGGSGKAGRDRALVTREELAGYLVSLPDRLAEARAELAPATFTHHTVEQLLTTLAEGSSSNGRSNSSSSSSSRDVSASIPIETAATGEAAAADGVSAGEAAAAESTSAGRPAASASAAAGPASPAAAWVLLDRQAGVEFCGLVVQRLGARGQGPAVTRVLVGLARRALSTQHSTQGCCSPSVLRSTLSDVLCCAAESAPGAVEKLLEHVLVLASSQRHSSGAAQHEAEPQQAQQDSGPQRAQQGMAHGSRGSAVAQAGQLVAWLVPFELYDQPGIRYHLCEKLLVHQTLPRPALETLLGFVLWIDPLQLVPITLQLAQFWGDSSTLQRVRVPRQAYMTTALVWLLQHMSRADLEGHPDLLSTLLQAISARLASPQHALRRQAMHVGHTFSLVLNPEEPLFQDQAPFAPGPEELWPGAVPTEERAGEGGEGEGEGEEAASGSVSSKGAKGDPASSTAAGKASGGAGTADKDWSDPDTLLTSAGSKLAEVETDSDREPLTASDSDDEFQPYDLDEGDELEEWEKGDAPISIRSLSAALRKQDDVDTVLSALKKVEVVVRAAPDELAAGVPELGRALLHCRVPDWTAAEAEREGRDAPEVQRMKGMVALLTQAPLVAGRALIPEIYTPHLDMQQRMTIMDVLCAAAQELARPPAAPRLTFDQTGVPRITPSQAPASSAPLPPATPTLTPTPSGPLPGAAGSDGRPAGGGSVLAAAAAKTRVWGHTSLRKRGERAKDVWHNRLVDVVMPWATALLREVDLQKHGIDMFGRDSLLLGRLLTTLGTFAEGCAGTPVMATLGGVVLELIQAPEVHGHSEPFVRRSALLAASQVMSSVVPGTLLDDSNLLTLERLEWVQSWASGIAASDPDTTSAYLAASCCQLYQVVLSQALVSQQQLIASSFVLPTRGGLQHSHRVTPDIVLPPRPQLP